MSGSDRSAPGDGKFFRILSLDGGGIRGVFPAAFLARLEEHLEHPIGRYFDLITGTSTGRRQVGNPPAAGERMQIRAVDEDLRPAALLELDPDAIPRRRRPWAGITTTSSTADSVM
jgi:hypothetical protein